MSKDVTRAIGRLVERELWARAAGRCQFAGCNRLLYKSPITQEPVSIAEQAHIHSFSEDGPRGWGLFAGRIEHLNDITNLMLVCHDCHKTMDADKEGERYSGELLRAMKAAHESRVEIVTGIHPDKRSHVVVYGANIGSQGSRLDPKVTFEALFPDWYPADQRPICLSMQWAENERRPTYWAVEEQSLRTYFERHVEPAIRQSDPNHFSLFGLAPMPLLVRLGALFGDQVPVEVYQLHRNPKTWRWQDPEATPQIVTQPQVGTGRQPVLLMSLSDTISHDRVTAVFGNDVSIWEITLPDPNNDFLQARRQLVQYRRAVRGLIDQIGRVHGKATPISVVPAMPVACAIELGRLRMPKADADWILYDYDNAERRFVETLTIRSNS